MEQKRKNISKKTRFEVFKRDNFTCQYCGRSAPDVILEIDHINPIKNGGDNNILNLITSCFDCNRGKGKRKLTDNEEIKIQIEQLKEINKKREQLEMLLKWKKELESFDDEQVDKIEELLNAKTGRTFSEYGRRKCKNIIKRYGFDEVYESTKISINQYYDINDTNSVSIVVDYIGRICATRKKQKDDPNGVKINYLIKIAKNRLYYVNDMKLKCLLRKNYEEEDFDYLKDIFCQVSNWTELREELEDYYGG